MDKRPRRPSHCHLRRLEILLNADGVSVSGNKAPVTACRIKQAVVLSADRPLQQARNDRVGGIIGARFLLG
ncbi:hypothetical protein ACVW04_000222 [Bradyrhizobium sp. LM2.3]